MNGFTTLLEDESGATMVEYALVMALLAGVALTALTGLGAAITQRLQDLAQQLTAAASG